jgi:hypothetical protein
MGDQLDSAQFVFSDLHRNLWPTLPRARRADKGKGADWEGSSTKLELYQAQSDTSKFVPVLFESQDEPFMGSAHETSSIPLTAYLPFVRGTQCEQSNRRPCRPR